MSPPTTFWSWKRTSSRLMTSYRVRSTCFAFTRSRQKVTPAATAPNSSWRRWLSVSARVRANAPVGVCLSYRLLSHTKVRNFDACDRRWVVNKRDLSTLSFFCSPNSRVSNSEQFDGRHGSHRWRRSYVVDRRGHFAAPQKVRELISGLTFSLPRTSLSLSCLFSNSETGFPNFPFCPGEVARCLHSCCDM